MTRLIEEGTQLAFYNEGIDIIIEFPVKPDEDIIRLVTETVKWCENLAHVDQVQHIQDKLDRTDIRYSLYTLRVRR